MIARISSSRSCFQTGWYIDEFAQRDMPGLIRKILAVFLLATMLILDEYGALGISSESTLIVVVPLLGLIDGTNGNSTSVSPSSSAKLSSTAPSGGLGLGLIVGIGCGVGGLVIVAVVVVLILLHRAKKKKQSKPKSPVSPKSDVEKRGAKSSPGGKGGAAAGKAAGGTAPGAGPITAADLGDSEKTAREVSQLEVIVGPKSGKVGKAGKKSVGSKSTDVFGKSGQATTKSRSKSKSKSSSDTLKGYPESPQDQKSLSKRGSDKTASDKSVKDGSKKLDVSGKGKDGSKELDASGKGEKRK